MTKAKKLTREDIIKWATSRSWKLDKQGHLQKEVSGKQYRLRLSSTSVRNEVKVHFEGSIYSKPLSEWLRLSSAYYKDLSISPEGKLLGMRQ